MATMFTCGHERVPENTYSRSDGSRPICRECTRAAAKDLRRRKQLGLPMKPHHNAAKVACDHGHAFTEMNTQTDSRGHRHCRACRREYMSDYNPKYRLKVRYHLTDQQRSDLLVSQDGLCAVCYVRPATHIDHDHGTGRVRGVLCHQCNVALGLMQDDPEILRAGADYLALSELEGVG